MLVQPSNRNKRPQDQPQLLYPTDALRRDLIRIRETDRAKRALRVMGREGGDKIEPFAAVIKCTSSQKKVDPKLRSKWVRALMFAARKKTPSESLGQFIRHLGGINACASQS